MATTTPLTTATVTDWKAAETYLDEHTSDAAYRLTALTALNDADLHEIILDPETRTIWWAYDNSPLDGEGWTIEQLTPKDAAAMAEGPVDTVQDRMDNPEAHIEAYLHGDDPDSDQDVLDEFASILLLGLPEDPATARVHISRQREIIAREDALWQRADANLVRDLTGERGGKTAAARVLGISDVQVGRIIRSDDQRRENLATAVREAKRRLQGSPAGKEC
jgi:hypothetical protein